MRLRVVRYILGFIIVLVIVFVYCHTASAEVVTYDVNELYYSGAKFTQYIDEYGNDYRIAYATKMDTGELHVMLLKNDELVLNWSFPCGSGGYNKSYLYVKQIVNEDGVRKGRVAWRVLTKYQWDEYTVAGRILDGMEGEITYPSEEYEDIMKGRVIIVIPAYDGFKDTTPVQSITFNYGVPLPTSGNPEDISISIEGGVTGTGEVISHSGYIKGGYYYGHARVTRELNTGVNEIIVKVTSNGVTYSASRVIERLMGQVDEDGDGIDDRTGLPIWPEYPETGDDNVPKTPGEDATIFDYIKYLSDSLVYAMNQMVVMIRSFMGGLAQLGQVFRSFFSFMPPQFSAIILLGLIMAVILRVMGR